MTLGAYLHGKVQGEDHSMMGYKKFKEFSSEVKGLIFWRSFFGFCMFIASVLSLNYLPI
jgi:hypothetical protein